MTVDEAKQKWCPMVRAECQEGTSVNVYFETGCLDRHPKWALCIGPDCMMWRWDTSFEQQPGEVIVSETSGRCGLAR